MRLIHLLPALLLSATASAALAQAVTKDISQAPAGTYVVEKSHASITFKAMHLGYANYVMRFNDFDATIQLDPKAPEKSMLEVTIFPASLDSHNQQLTQHTSSKDFFDIEKFPLITFKSTSIEKTGANTGKITGDLTMRGVTKPIVLDAVFNGGGAHPMIKKYDIGFSATTTVKRSDFGVSYGTDMVSDLIPVSIEAEFIQK